jgi:hypothetical protein
VQPPAAPRATRVFKLTMRGRTLSAPQGSKLLAKIEAHLRGNMKDPFQNMQWMRTNRGAPQRGFRLVTVGSCWVVGWLLSVGCSSRLESLRPLTRSPQLLLTTAPDQPTQHIRKQPKCEQRISPR